MKYILIAFMLIGFMGQAQWYTGGDLHSKTMTDWNNASYKNKIATSADFLVVYYSNELNYDKEYIYDNFDLIKKDAEELVKCMNGVPGRKPASLIAVRCLRIINYKLKL